jgi:hypothetical protein
MSKARAALTHAMAVLVILGLPATNAADALLEQQNAVEDMGEATHAKRRNHVIVSSQNGDYPNPIAAAENALTGDSWCVSPQLPKHPCVINILAGIYILPQTLSVPAGVALQGVEKHRVLLVAGRGVPVAVASEGPLIRDLSIISDEPGGIALAFNQRLRRVFISARFMALAGGDVCCFPGFPGPTAFDISDSEIVGRIEGVLASLRAERSRISGDIRIAGLEKLELRNTHVSATRVVQDLILTNETLGDVVIIGGSLTAPGNYALAVLDILGRDIGRDIEILIVGTHVNGSIRLNRETEGFNTFDGVTVIGEIDSGGPVTGTTTILRSYIDASARPNELALWLGGELAEPIRIRESFVKGAVRLATSGHATITSSVLAGPLLGNRNNMTCKNVFDENYQRFESSCPPD